MKSKSLKQRTDAAMDILNNQELVTLKEAKVQVLTLKNAGGKTDLPIISGKLSNEWDILKVIVEGNKLELDTISMGGKEFRIGEEIKGVIVKGKFCLCRNYNLKDGRKLFGFISKDMFMSTIIVIAIIAENPEVIVTKRTQVKNYYLKQKSK